MYGYLFKNKQKVKVISKSQKTNCKTYNTYF